VLARRIAQLGALLVLTFRDGECRRTIRCAGPRDDPAESVV
jgi:hypothetical protein